MSGKKVQIVEVGPRDGLQNEKAMLSVEQRLNFIKHLAASGLISVQLEPHWAEELTDADWQTIMGTDTSGVDRKSVV